MPRRWVLEQVLPLNCCGITYVTALFWVSKSYNRINLLGFILYFIPLIEAITLEYKLLHLNVRFYRAKSCYVCSSGGMGHMGIANLTLSYASFLKNCFYFSCHMQDSMRTWKMGVWWEKTKYIATGLIITYVLNDDEKDDCFHSGI